MKRAIIVGATSGIGRRVAIELRRAGWHIGVAGRRADLLDELAKAYPDIATERIDITAADASERLQALIDKVGGMDLYFHSSGIGFQNRELDTEIELHTVRTNCEGFVRMVDTAYHYFAKQGHGHIAVISSIAGTKGLGAAPAYSATKAMNNTYIQALAQLAHMQKHDILFTDIRPGFVATDLLGDGKHYPMLMRPEKVANTIVKAINSKKRVAVIDWRYRALVFFWRLIPRWIWERLNIQN